MRVPDREVVNEAVEIEKASGRPTVVNAVCRTALFCLKTPKKGWRLLYSVCSTEPDEGEEVLNEFLKTAEDFRIIDAEAVF